jgi:hypothetical protein
MLSKFVTNFLDNIYSLEYKAPITQDHCATISKAFETSKEVGATVRDIIHSMEDKYKLEHLMQFELNEYINTAVDIVEITELILELLGLDVLEDIPYENKQELATAILDNLDAIEDTIKDWVQEELYERITSCPYVSETTYTYEAEMILFNTACNVNEQLDELISQGVQCPTIQQLASNYIANELLPLAISSVDVGVQDAIEQLVKDIEKHYSK